MQSITSFRELTSHLQQNSKRIRLAVVCADDASTAGAVARAVSEGFAEAIFVGNPEGVQSHACIQELPSEYVSYQACTSHAEAAERAVRLVHEGRADVLVKGLLHTATLLRAVLNKEWGLLPQGRVLTHIAAAEIPAYGKLLFFTDAAVIPYPTHEQRLQQVGYMTQLIRAFGVSEPRLSLIHCAETASEKFPHTLGYADIRERAQRGEWGSVRIDGPLDLRTSCDPIALRIKGINSSLEGQADGLILPDIEAGNVLYKVLPLFASARMAGTLQGTIAPVVLPSRGDDLEAKYNSLALATISASAHS